MRQSVMVRTSPALDSIAITSRSSRASFRCSGSSEPGSHREQLSRAVPAGEGFPLSRMSLRGGTGSNFSNAIRPATTAIQMRLITPSANSEAIRAQQHPMHQPPWLIPIRSPPTRPLRQEPSRKPRGLLHFPRQTFLSGVNSYAAATISVAPASPSACSIPREHTARDPAPGRRECKRQHSRARPGREIAAGEKERGDR